MLPNCLRVPLFVLCIVPRSFGQEPSTAPATANDPATPAAGHSLHGEAFNDGPRQAAVLLPGMGEVHFAMTTASEACRAFINQGVAQLHSFYYLEAERSFRQAAMLDPGCPMAYWGMAMANVNNEKRAREFIKQARSRVTDSNTTRRERLYIDSLEARLQTEGNEKDRRKRQIELQESIVEEFPDDVDARCWLAMLTWQNEGQDGIGSRVAVDELLASAERLQPMHPGAHHYRIHLWDHHKAPRALTSARLGALAAPGIAHAWHMPGHTFTELKQYPEAAYQQEGSARVDHAAMLRDRIMPFEIHNYAHNNQWLATSLGRVGRAREGIAMARNLVEQPHDPDRNKASDGGSAQASGRARWSELLSLFEMWDELIRVTRSGELDWSDQPREQVARHRFLGLAFAGKGDQANLAHEVQELEKLRPSEPADAAEAKDEAAQPAEGEAPAADPGKPPEEKQNGDKPRGKRPHKPKPPEGLEDAIGELTAYQRLLAGQNTEALAALDKSKGMLAVEKARFQLRAGQPDQAIATARAAVKESPNEVVPLATLVEVLHAAGKDDEARATHADLAPYLKQADPDLPIVARVRGFAAAWPERASDKAPPRPVPTFADLGYLGPLYWQPYAAPELELSDTTGQTWRIPGRPGRNTLVLFYLGGGCAHCMQQLTEFSQEAAAFDALGTDLIAISTDDAETTRRLKNNSDGVVFAMPMLADPSQAAFRAYRCHDDFENAPLHGTFLVDREGKIRFQRISADPFLDTRFLKAEIERVNRLTPRSDPSPGM